MSGYIIIIQGETPIDAHVPVADGRYITDMLAKIVYKCVKTNKGT